MSGNVNFTYKINSFFIPDVKTAAGEVLNDLKKESAFQQPICQQNVIKAIATRIFAALLYTLLSAVDLLFWIVKTVTILPAYNQGCYKHTQNAVAAIVSPTISLGMLAGYLPTA